jgi:predicted RNA binding protein YcfA (HicA-like mRNA interferase family)
VRYSELTRKLRRLGIEFRRQARGSHEVWWDPRRELYTLIPYHRSREIKKKTLATILKDLGLKEEDLQGL